jgi:hypothetical protein
MLPGGGGEAKVLLRSRPEPISLTSMCVGKCGNGVPSLKEKNTSPPVMRIGSAPALTGMKLTNNTRTTRAAVLTVTRCRKSLVGIGHRFPGRPEYAVNKRYGAKSVPQGVSAIVRSTFKDEGRFLLFVASRFRFCPKVRPERHTARCGSSGILLGRKKVRRGPGRVRQGCWYPARIRLGPTGRFPQIPMSLQPTFTPMHPLRIPQPLEHPDSLFEPKMDGFRVLAQMAEHRARSCRNGNAFKS